MGQICGFLWTRKMQKGLQLQGDLAPTGGSAPWTSAMGSASRPPLCSRSPRDPIKPCAVLNRSLALANVLCHVMSNRNTDEGSWQLKKVTDGFSSAVYHIWRARTNRWRKTVSRLTPAVPYAVLFATRDRDRNMYRPTVNTKHLRRARIRTYRARRISTTVAAWNLAKNARLTRDASWGT